MLSVAEKLWLNYVIALESLMVATNSVVQVFLKADVAIDEGRVF
jgi:hypothetical protein